jgi:trans-aconitate methyltransferase
MDLLQSAWSSFSAGRAAEYLRGYGSPAESSKRLLADILAPLAAKAPLSLVDLGCGNAQLLDYLRERKIPLRYTGVDFSEPLLAVAETRHAADPDVRFLRDDVNSLERVQGRYDVAIYSHVLEILASPEQSLARAWSFADRVMIRFFEPPEFEVDTVELREMDVGEGAPVPYIRRKMSRDYYRLILAKLGCARVDVYRDEFSKDQVHVLQR